MALVEVDPATVLEAATQLRCASRAYSAAGWRISTSLPLTPPRFMVQTQLALDAVALGLQALAVQLEVDAAVEAWRMSRLAEAGAGDVGFAVQRLLSDLGAEARRAWDDLSREEGLEAWVDPLGGNVQLLLGAWDNLTQLLETASIIGHLDPACARLDPAGASRARQEAIAMAINLVELSPATAALDPEGHRVATERTVLKLVDWNDLEHGDVPRWVGHIGAGVLLTMLTRGLAPAADAAGSEAAVGTTESGLAEAFNSGYGALNNLNHLPTERGRPLRRQQVPR